LQTKPILTKSLTAATLNGLSELIASLVTTGKVDGKWVKMSAYGLFISGPLGHHLYAQLEKVFKGKTGTGWAIAKLLATNLVVSPILNSVYLFTMALIAGQNISESIKSVRSRFMAVMKTTWVVFPTVQTIAFNFLPPALWLPFFNLVAFTIGLYINIATKLAAQRKKALGGAGKAGGKGKSA
ncbi:hypothetical protein HK101_010706, partial [Irineochytrium annulatum]